MHTPVASFWCFWDTYIHTYNTPVAAIVASWDYSGVFWRFSKPAMWFYCVCMHVHMYCVCIQVHMYVCMRICAYDESKLLKQRIPTHKYIHTHTYMHTYVYSYAYLHVLVSIHTHMRTYMHVTYKRIHACFEIVKSTNTYTYAYLYAQ